MSKKVVRVMKIQFPAGGAKPGPALAGAGIQMPKFCTAFNDQTKDRMGETVPVVLTIYDDMTQSMSGTCGSWRRAGRSQG